MRIERGTRPAAVLAYSTFQKLSSENEDWKLRNFSIAWNQVIPHRDLILIRFYDTFAHRSKNGNERIIKKRHMTLENGHAISPGTTPTHVLSYESHLLFNRSIPSLIFVMRGKALDNVDRILLNLVYYSPLAHPRIKNGKRFICLMPRGTWASSDNAINL